MYPEEYEKFLSYISFVNLDIGVLVSYSCLVSPGYYGRLVLATATPLGVLVILAYGYSIAKGRYLTSPQYITTIWHRHLSAALLVFFFVYSSVSSIIFQAFVCDEKLPGDRSLVADHRILCDTRLHSNLMIYAGVMAVVYPIGIPALIMWWLRRNRNHLTTSNRETTVHLQPFSGVWSTYRPSRYYFEVVEYLRRLTLSLSSVFLVPDGVDHIAVVLSLAVVFHVVSEYLSPFQKRVDMNLYRWGNLIILVSMYIALLIKAKESDGEVAVFSVFGWVLIAANVVMILVVVVEAVIMGGLLAALIPRVQVNESPARRPTPITFNSIRSVHPWPIVHDQSAETEEFHMSRLNDIELPDAPPEAL